ncbi:hypothetical protein F4604DRAFT_1116594 [Suillus subluteus]|nr:hypothetical protein F4604DRAFT_1116594 [Suillus subluteus]
MLGTLGPRWIRLSEALIGAVCATGEFARRSHERLSAALHNGLRSLVLRSSKNVGDSEAPPDLDVLAGNDDTLSLDLPDISTSNLEAPSIKWLLETSTDPEVFFAAVTLVPLVEWPLDLDVSDMLPWLYDISTSCIDIHGQIVPSLEEKASACIMALSHLYCGRVLQAYPGRGGFIGRGRGDYDMFDMMTQWSIGTANKTVLAPAKRFCVPAGHDDGQWQTFWLDECPDSVLEWLSHSLPYHFVTGRVNRDVERFAIEVISRLLSSPSSPSTQIIANCTLLACLMVGVQFDKKVIIRVDKRCS